MISLSGKSFTFVGFVVFYPWSGLVYDDGGEFCETEVQSMQGSLTSSGR